MVTLLFNHSLLRTYPLMRTSGLARLRRTYSAAAESAVLICTNIPAPSNGHIRLLELQRPKARNAISRNLLSALAREIDDVHRQYTPNGDEVPQAGPTPEGPTRALVIASAIDESFCAGADLKERKEMNKEEYSFALFS